MTDGDRSPAAAEPWHSNRTRLRRARPVSSDAFARAVELLRAAEGRVIVSGVGKSGIIARKIAATFTSTGTPSVFIHPVDSLHGDLGGVSRRDVGRPAQQER